MPSKKRNGLSSALRKAVRWPRPKISVIVPIYKAEAYVEKCLRSIMAQTFAEIEIICVDDASPDGSAEIVKRLAREDGRISLIRHDNNRGIGGARNTGIAAARAAFVIGVDSDDWIKPNMMARLWEASGEGLADITTCGFAVVSDDGKILDISSLPEQTHRNDSNEVDILNLLKPALWNKLIRKTLFTSNWISIPEHMYFQDLATTPRLLRFARDIRVIPDILYCYVQRNNSITNSTSPQHIVDYFRVFDVLTEFLHKQGLMDRYHNQMLELIGKHLHYHAGYLTSNGVIGECNAQFMRYMILMKLAYLEFNEALRTADPAAFPEILLKATSREDLVNMLATHVTSPAKISNKMPLKRRYSLSSALRKGAMRWMSGHRNDETGPQLFPKPNQANRLEAHPMPKISVIVPIYKTEAYVEKCLRSIMEQTLPEIEIICVDDASPDGSAEIVKRLAREDGRISLIRHDHNRGLGGARNTGIAAAQAAFVIGVDSDDWIKPNMMARLWEASGEGIADITTCGLEVMSGDGKIRRGANLPEQAHRNDSNEVDIFNLLKPSFCNKIIRKTLFTLNGIKFPEHMYYEDLATTPRILRFARDIRVIPDRLYCYVQRNNSITNSTSPQHIIDYFRVFDILTEFLNKEGLIDRYHDEILKLIGKSLHHHTHYLTSTGVIGERNAQFIRYMIMLKLTYLDFNEALRTADPVAFPEILLKATSRADLERKLAAQLMSPAH